MAMNYPSFPLPRAKVAYQAMMPLSMMMDMSSRVRAAKDLC